MMLVKFGGGVMYDVDGMPPSDRYDLEAAHKLLKAIENRYGRWSSCVIVIVGVFFLIGSGFANVENFWSEGLFAAGVGCVPAGMAALAVARITRQNTLSDVATIEVMLRTKKNGACTAFIRERVFRSSVLRSTLEPAFINAEVPIVAP